MRLVPMAREERACVRLREDQFPIDTFTFSNICLEWFNDNSTRDSSAKERRLESDRSFVRSFTTGMKSCFELFKRKTMPREGRKPRSSGYG